jgi:hypothetical protein
MYYYASLKIHSISLTCTSGGTQPGLGKLCGAASTSAEVRALLQCAGVCAALEQVLGQGWDARQPGTTPLSGQVAMRFPEHTHLSAEELDSAGTRNRILKSYGEQFDVAESEYYLITNILVAWHTDGFRRGKVHEFRYVLYVFDFNLFLRLFIDISLSFSLIFTTAAFC